jgi:hypothetical protein
LLVAMKQYASLQKVLNESNDGYVLYNYLEEANPPQEFIIAQYLNVSFTTMESGRSYLVGNGILPTNANLRFYIMYEKVFNLADGEPDAYLGDFPLVRQPVSRATSSLGSTNKSDSSNNTTVIIATVISVILLIALIMFLSSRK